MFFLLTNPVSLPPNLSHGMNIFCCYMYPLQNFSFVQVCRLQLMNELESSTFSNRCPALAFRRGCIRSGNFYFDISLLYVYERNLCVLDINLLLYVLSKFIRFMPCTIFSWYITCWSSPVILVVLAKGCFIKNWTSIKMW